MYTIRLPMRKEETPSKKRVSPHTREMLESFNETRIDPFRSKLVNKFVVVDCGYFAINRCFALHCPWVNYLLRFIF